MQIPCTQVHPAILSHIHNMTICWTNKSALHFHKMPELPILISKPTLNFWSFFFQEQKNLTITLPTNRFQQKKKPLNDTNVITEDYESLYWLVDRWWGELQQTSNTHKSLYTSTKTASHSATKFLDSIIYNKVWMISVLLFFLLQQNDTSGSSKWSVDKFVIQIWGQCK